MINMKAIQYLRPNAEFVMTDDDPTTIIWHTEGVTTPTAKQIKDAIKDDASAGGDKVVEGNLFKATYIESNRSVVDSKALFAELGATPEQIARHTKVTAVFSVKVTSR